MDLEQALKGVTPALYQRLVNAVETGRWPDGQILTAEQKENAMSLVMLYQAKKLDEEEHFKINSQGELITKTKADMQEELKIRAARRRQREGRAGVSYSIPTTSKSQEGKQSV